MNVGIVSAAPGQTLVDKMGWVADGFLSAGHSVRRCHSIGEVIAADRHSDLMVFDHKGAGVCRNALADYAPRRKSAWVQWWRDAVAYYGGTPLRQQPYMSFLRLMRNMDVVLVKERSLLGEYHSLGIPAQWFDQACPQEMPACEHPEQPEIDVLIPGTACYRQRTVDARALADEGLRVAFVGLPGGNVPANCTALPWVHPVKGLPQLVSKSAVVLGVDFRSDLHGFTSDRTYLVAGMGGCLVRRATPEMPDVPSFEYHDCEQLTKLVRMLVGNHAARKRTGEAARQAVLSKHTYKHRADEIVSLSAKAEKRQCVAG